jgi:STELLO glycosyltransferases
MLYSVITTIQEPTQSVIKLAERLAGSNDRLVIVGDTKGPRSFDLGRVNGFQTEQLTFLDISAQLGGDFELGGKLPTRHYARKNMGYLYAISYGASCIYETDDDNAPLSSWSPREPFVDARKIGSAAAPDRPVWVNVYKHFTQANIWPRGLPLDQIHTPLADAGAAERTWAPIQQGLANGAPDVDAVWRLVMDAEFSFEHNSSVVVQPGQWCPFNTQSTWWWPEVYPLLYVPSYCSFRMCDIWKSFVAQRCLWELGAGVVFHAPEVYQQRNPHNLMRDFGDEVVGYLKNDRIASILRPLKLKSGKDLVRENLVTCYSALINEDIFPEKEFALLQAWLSALEQIEKTPH